MTDRPPPPGPPLGPFLDGLPDPRLRALLGHVGAGLFNARHAAQCVTEPGSPRHETVLQLATYISEAIRELEQAREIVRAELEGGADR